MDLKEKISKQKFRVGVIGLGYVGLPLSREFLSKNIKVIGFDIDKKQLETLKDKKSYIKHIPDKDIKSMVEKGFEPTNDFRKISEVDVIIICVPTPLTKFREPDLRPIISTGEQISKFLRKDQLVLLESSTYPGTTDEVLCPILEKSGLQKDQDFFVAYSPEREDPGNEKFNTSTIPKIVGADTETSRMLAESVYKTIIEQVHLVSSSKTAEATKLTENIFRSVNIALSNELKIIFNKMDVDVWEVINAASTKPFGYMPFYPGPGLGGHCIPIDPFYLTYKAKEYGIQTRFIELAGELNTFMPNYVLNNISEALNKFCKLSFSRSKILLIGLAYKQDVDDMRESPSLVLIEALKNLGSKVDYHDEYIPEIKENRDHPSLIGMKSVALNEKNLDKYDCILIATNHKYLDYKLIAEKSKLIVDTRNSFENIALKAAYVKS